MKKLLALVLALVMVMGLATVGANAALEDFSDAADVQYEEAMAVMNTVGVFQGSDGKLTPKDNLTRAQAAKIIAYLNLGETAAETLSKDVTAFTDVAAGAWYTGYITYCYNTGIVGGKGDNKFDPDANVTGLEFAKMLLVTLGYDAQREGLVGADYALNTSKLAAKNELFAKNEGLSVNKAATREEAALYAFNALKAPTYEYATASTTVRGADGLEVIVGGSNATVVTTGANRAAITTESAAGGGAVDVLQLGEKLYKGDLKISAAATTDGMDRPATVWTWKTGANNEIGRYAKTADYTSVIKKTQIVSEAVDDISKSIDDTTAGIVSVNGGVGTNANATTVQAGDYIEVFMNSAAPGTAAAIVITRYQIDQLTADAATKGTGKDMDVRLPGVTGLTSWTDAENVTGYEGLKKDDVVYYYKDSADNWTVAKADSFEGQLLGVKTNSTPNKYTISGTDYVINAVASGTVDGLDTNRTFNTGWKYWTDNNGFIIWGEKVEETNDNYVWIERLEKVAGDGSIGSSAYVQARFVKLDGSVETGKVEFIDNGTNKYQGTNPTNNTSTQNNASADSPNAVGSGRYLVDNDASLNDDIDTAAEIRTQLYTYELNSGKYEFTQAGKGNADVTTGSSKQDSNTTTKPANGTIGGGGGTAVAVNDKTVFVVVNDPSKLTLTGSPKFSVYTGKDNAPSLVDGTNDLEFAYTMEKNVATNVFIFNYDTTYGSGDWLYVASPVVGTTQVTVDGSKYTYNVVKALKSGSSEVENVMLSATATGKLVTNGLGRYTPQYDSKTGAVSDMTASAQNKTGVFGYALSGGILSTAHTFGSNGATYAANRSYACPNDATLIWMDTDDNFTVSTTADLSADENDMIYVTVDPDNASKAKFVFVIERNSDEKGVSIATSVGTLQTTTPTPTTNIEGVASTKYTQYLSDTRGTATYTLTFKAGCDVYYNTNAATTNPDWAATDFSGGTHVTTDGTVTSLSLTAIAADTTYNFKVVAEDGSVSYFQLIHDQA